MPHSQYVESGSRPGSSRKTSSVQRSHASSSYSSSYSSSRSTRVGSVRPQFWRCCRCSGGWYSCQINDSCPMCQSWRCDNCEYSMS